MSWSIWAIRATVLQHLSALPALMEAASSRQVLLGMSFHQQSLFSLVAAGHAHSGSGCHRWGACKPVTDHDQPQQVTYRTSQIYPVLGLSPKEQTTAATYPVSYPNAVQRSDRLECPKETASFTWPCRASGVRHLQHLLHETQSTPHGLLAEFSLLSCPTSGRLDLSSLQEASIGKSQPRRVEVQSLLPAPWWVPWTRAHGS